MALMYVMRRGLGAGNEAVVSDVPFPVTGGTTIPNMPPETQGGVQNYFPLSYYAAPPVTCDPGIDPTCGQAPGSITSWINANSGLVLGIGGGFLALMLLAKAGR